MDHIVNNFACAALLLLALSSIVVFLVTLLTILKKPAPEKLKDIWDHSDLLRLFFIFSMDFTSDYEEALVKNRVIRLVIYAAVASFFALLAFGFLLQRLQEALGADSNLLVIDYLIWLLIALVSLVACVRYSFKLLH